MVWAVLGALAAVFVVLIGMSAWHIRRRHMQYWLPAYLKDRRRFQEHRSSGQGA